MTGIKASIRFFGIAVIGSFMLLQIYFFFTRSICHMKVPFMIETITYGEFLEWIPQAGNVEIDMATNQPIIKVEIDEMYKNRISKGLKAKSSINDKIYELQIIRVDSFVSNGRFVADMKFINDVPDSLIEDRVRMRVILSEPSSGILLPVGGYYTSTMGEWIFVVNERDMAIRQKIKLGKKNADHFVVKEGLKPGDRVITSSYEAFEDVDSLNILKMENLYKNY